MFMQRRPATIRVRNACVRRKTCRRWVVFAVLLTLLLCCDLNVLLALLLAGAGLLALEICAFRC